MDQIDMIYFRFQYKFQSRTANRSLRKTVSKFPNRIAKLYLDKNVHPLKDKFVKMYPLKIANNHLNKTVNK